MDKFSDFYRMRFCLNSAICLFLVFAIVVSVSSQSNQVRFEHLNSGDGLSANVVNCIYQDKSGFMWFGTNDGLNRYDGYEFTIYNHSPDQENAINSNLVFDITEDSHGHIWIGTTGSGLNRFDPFTESFAEYRHEPGNPLTINDDQVLCLETDSKGRIWIGSINGLNLIMPRKSPNDPPTFTQVKLPDRGSIFRVNCVKEDKSGNIWVATRYGLFLGRPNGGSLNDLALEQVHIAGFPNVSVRYVEFDQHGRLLLGTSDGIFYQSKQGNIIAFERFHDATSTQSIVVDGDGTIWAGTYAGIWSFTAYDRNEAPNVLSSFTAQQHIPYSLSNNVIRYLFIDKTGLVWAGTGGSGICKFDPEGKPFIHFGQNLSFNGTNYTAIRAIEEDSKGDLWLGTEGGGLFWQNDGNNASVYSRFERLGLSSKPYAISEVIEDGASYVYVGSEDPPYLQKFDISKDIPVAIESILEIDGSVFSILQDEKQMLWVGTYNQGLFRFKPQPAGGYQGTRFKKEDSQSNNLSSDIVRKLYEDRSGNIWIGTANGLDLIESNQAAEEYPTIHKFTHSSHDPSSLSHDYVLDIHETSDGNLWIGTFGGGLNQLIPYSLPDSIHFIKYLERDGLSNNSVKSIEEDADGNLWLATNRGLVRFDVDSKTFQNYSPQHGLQGDEFYEVASTVRSNGELLFGGVNGFNVFYPENILENKIPPTVHFTKLLVHHSEVDPGQKVKGKVLLDSSICYTDEITLKFSDNDFSVEFAALHFSAPSQNKYQYMLEGYHDQWIETASIKRYATFTNLPHGSYKLKVRAANSDDVWVTDPAILSIHIKPPLWLAWYAYLIYGLIVLGALLLFRRYTLISIKEKHNLKLEHLEREKLEELNQMKLRFFTNISHELRTPITLIINPLEHILEMGRSITPEKLQQQYHYMYKNGKYLLRLVNQLLDFRKLDQGSLNLRVGNGDIIQFIQETTEPFQFVANKKNIHFDVLSSNYHVYTYFDPEVVEKVMYNLLSNAFKFAPKDGCVFVKISEVNNPSDQSPLVEIRVVDDGPGVPNKKKKKIFERFVKENNRTENKDGAGIGLAFTKSLVELHRGKIFLDPSSEKGACFVVQIPREKSVYLRSEVDQFHMERFVATSDPLEYLVADSNNNVLPSVLDVNMKEKEDDLPLLLFIDDNADIRQFIKEGFQNDFRIITAEDGEIGYELAKSSLPEIIVSDVMMPNMDGIELCRILKSDTLTSHIPVVLLTAKSTDENKLEGLKIGADAYVAKPFILEVLRTQLLNIHLHRERLKQKYRQEVLLNPKDITVTSADEKFLKRAMDIIEDNMSDSEFNVNAFVKEMYISRSKLYLKLRALTGLSTSEFIRSVRLKRAVQLLEKSNYTIKEIMYKTGFSTASYFSKCFKKQFGVVPSEYLKNQKQLESLNT